MSNENTTSEAELQGLDNQMAGQETAGNESVPSSEETLDPQNWEEAFAAVESKTETQSRPATISSDDDDKEAGKDDDGADADTGSGTSTDDVDVDAGDVGGSVSTDGDDFESDESEYTDSIIQERIQEYQESIEEEAINDTAQLMLTRVDSQGNPVVRSTNGVLGATINDPDIYRRDESGIAQFFNPDTGRPFTGDNPRAQAKQWVEQYNEELKEAFNTLAQNRIAELTENITPIVELLEFTPTYESLDPVRQQMLDGIIGDYEVFDSNGDHVGYSCDLNQALAQVNRQVANIKAHRAAQSGTQEHTGATAGTSASASNASTDSYKVNIPAKESSGPALDMRTGSGNSNTGSVPEFKSIAEAMEYEQNKQLETLRNKGRR